MAQWIKEKIERRQKLVTIARRLPVEVVSFLADFCYSSDEFLDRVRVLLGLERWKDRATAAGRVWRSNLAAVAVCAGSLLPRTTIVGADLVVRAEAAF